MKNRRRAGSTDLNSYGDGEEWSPISKHGKSLGPDLEVKATVRAAVVMTDGDPLENLFRHYSSWHRLIRAAA